MSDAVKNLFRDLGAAGAAAFGGPAPKLDLAELAEDAISAAADASDAIDALQAARNELAGIMSRASDASATGEQAEAKIQMIHTWRATIDQFDRGLIALGRKP